MHQIKIDNVHFQRTFSVCCWTLSSTCVTDQSHATTCKDLYLQSCPTGFHWNGRNNISLYRFLMLRHYMYNCKLWRSDTSWLLCHTSAVQLKPCPHTHTSLLYVPALPLPWSAQYLYQYQYWGTVTYMCTHTHTHTYMCTHTHIHVYTHTHTHTCVHTHTHTCVHTHIHVRCLVQHVHSPPTPSLSTHEFVTISI